MQDRKVGRNTTRVDVGATGLVITKRFDGPSPDRERRYENSLAWDALQKARGLDLGPPVAERDDERLVLSFPYLDNLRTLQEILDEGAGTEALVPVLRRCGALLGTLHSVPVDEVTRLLPRREAPADPGMGPLTVFSHLTPEQYTNASGAELEAWRLFHHDTELQEGLRSWVADQTGDPDPVPVHGDLRPDQFLVSSEHLALIDWEEFTVGPASRDLAGIAGSLVFDALVRTFVGAPGRNVLPGELHRGFMSRGEDLLGAVAPSVQAFLAAYRNVSGRDVDALRLGSDIGWFLIERVMARAMMSHRLPPSDRAIAGVGRQAILNPASALAILGMGNDS
ncbi:phosphotransferase [Nocardiopsis halotolerans]|uniref:phosphotransferase n=1 Tax=Nocardiopsis halotolerans TaxID=124252 RepID=UPI0019D3370E|nr:phosphotransferase [Nocardiopsis halotolerans]